MYLIYCICERKVRNGAKKQKNIPDKKELVDSDYSFEIKIKQIFKYLLYIMIHIYISGSSKRSCSRSSTFLQMSIIMLFATSNGK